MRLSPPQLLVISFLGAIVIGALFLCLPGMVHEGVPWSFLDALFTSASAICVTGLVVVNTGASFTPCGLWVILALIQIGGLGILTFSTFFALFVGRHLSIREHHLFQLFFSQLRVEGIGALLRYIVLFTLAIEGAGFLSYFYHFYFRSGLPLGEAAWIALFHAVSAFCNAGFSLFSDSITSFRADAWMNITTISLSIAGALGFVVLLEFYRIALGGQRKPNGSFNLTLQTKMVLAVTVGIGVIGTLFYFWALRAHPWGFGERGLAALFLSLGSPTAGFQSMDLRHLPVPALFFLMFLIYVGGAPGSTAGGIKNTTLLVLAVTFIAMLRNRDRISIFRRSIPQSIVRKSLVILIVGWALGFVFLLMLLCSEYHGHPFESTFFLDHLFELVSALGTSGVSLGITSGLSSVGKCIIILAMFVGRVGPLTLALAVTAKAREPLIQYPEENVLVG